MGHAIERHRDGGDDLNGGVAPGLGAPKQRVDDREDCQPRHVAAARGYSIFAHFTLISTGMSSGGRSVGLCPALPSKIVVDMTREEVFAMCPALVELEEKLGGVEGKERIELSGDGAGGCLPVLDADEQLARSVPIDLPVVPVEGAAHECHANSILRFEHDPTLTFATGFALGSDELWYHHSWIIEQRGSDEVILETTPEPDKLRRYVGLRYQGEEAFALIEQFRVWLGPRIQSGSKMDAFSKLIPPDDPPADPKDDDVQLSMLENGLDFIRSGLKHIAKPVSKFDLKYAVLHLSAGIELVLKDRLRREDWTQIFVKPEDATPEKLKSGNFKSVNLHQCLERLEEHCPVELPDKALLQSFKDQRNPIEHFELNHSRAALEASSAIVLGSLLDFIGEAYEEEDLSRDESDLLQEIRTSLAEFKRFTTERMAEIQWFLEDHKKHHGEIVVCPSCIQDALMADCDVKCAFCGYAASAEDAAELYITNTLGVSRYYCMKEGETYPLRNCPNCDNEALVYEEGYTENDGICFACGNTPSPGDLTSCDQCQELCDPDDLTGGMCMDCFRAYVAQDNT